MTNILTNKLINKLTNKIENGVMKKYIDMVRSYSLDMVDKSNNKGGQSGNRNPQTQNNWIIIGICVILFSVVVGIIVIIIKKRRNLSLSLDKGEGLLDKYIYSDENRAIIAHAKMEPITNACLTPIIVLFPEYLELYAQHMKAEQGKLVLNVESMEQFIRHVQFQDKDSFKPFLEKINRDFGDVGEERELRNKLVLKLAVFNSEFAMSGKKAIDLFDKMRESKRGTEIVLNTGGMIIFYVNLITCLKSRVDPLISFFFTAPFVDVACIKKILPLASKLIEYYRPLTEEIEKVEVQTIDQGVIDRVRSMTCVGAYETGAIFQTIYKLLGEGLDLEDNCRGFREKIIVAVTKGILDTKKREKVERLVNDIREICKESEKEYNTSFSGDLDKLQGMASLHQELIERNKKERAASGVKTVRDENLRKLNKKDSVDVRIKRKEEEYMNKLIFTWFLLDFLDKFISGYELPERWKYIISKSFKNINGKAYENLKELT